ncbi:type II toxin-antitoxin system RelE/ParE family toxin [Pseudomonas sp. B22129]|uniref:type II toxin-antitoxin system RelE/ParE family toxin n=1 Tax=Pseudomonas sp. B22129 TaxID=3235111 RepID=UPI003784F37F
MSYSVAFSPEALAQLDALEDYIGHTGSPLAAARLVDNIIGYCESLALFPQRGNRRDDVLPHLRITHYRHTTAIAFRVEPDIQKVSILGVFYGGQNYSALLSHDEE